MKIFKKILFYLLFVPITIMLVILSVGNKHSVAFFFNPIADAETIFQISAPLYLYIFISFLAGAIAGYIIAKIRNNNKIKRLNTQIIIKDQN